MPSIIKTPFMMSIRQCDLRKKASRIILAPTHIQKVLGVQWSLTMLCCQDLIKNCKNSLPKESLLTNNRFLRTATVKYCIRIT